MNRTRALIIIGGFMLVLAVLAALELRKEDAVVAEGQMVTGSIAATQVPSNGLRQSPAGDNAVSSSGGTISLADNSLRSQQEGISPAPVAVSAPAAPSQTHREVIAPLATAQTVPNVSSKPAAVRENTLLAGEGRPEDRAVAQQSREPVKEDRPEPKQSEQTPEARPLVLTTKGPAKLQGKQKAITQTRLELGKTITFHLTGAAPLSAKTLLLTSPHRYVVDLQGEWGVALPKVPNNLLLQEIRVGQRENATRLVLELKRKPESAQVVKIDAQTLEVRIRY